MRYPKAFHDAAKIQRNIMDTLDTIPTKDLGNIAKAYCALEQLKLRIQMKPAPRPLDTTKLPNKDKPTEQPTFTE